MNKETIKKLDFVWKKYTLTDIEVVFAEKYQQRYRQTDFQKELKFIENPLRLLPHEVFLTYKIDETILYELYGYLEKRAIKSGIDIHYVDMSQFSEDVFYENDHEGDLEHENHAETARSDGQELLLEKDLKKIGGIQGRIYDLIHLAFGHMIQWSVDGDELLLTREEAWNIGYRNHDVSPDSVLDMVRLYEFEAGMMGVQAIRRELDIMQISEQVKDRIIQYFTDYVYCDRDYIIQHYRGNHKAFQSFWKFGNDVPKQQKVVAVDTFIKRHVVELGLIKDLQK